MSQSIYDFCFLQTDMKIDTSSDLQTNLKDDSLCTNMSIVDMQMNDILMLINSNFAVAKEKVIVVATVMTKSRNDLDFNSLLKFNDKIIERQQNVIYLKQIFQLNHLQLIKIVNFITVSFKSKIRIALISRKQ
jgi:hypothetical protein